MFKPFFCVLRFIACFFVCPFVLFFIAYLFLYCLYTLCLFTLACEWVLRVSSAFRVQQWFIGDCYFRNLIRLRSGWTALSNGMVRLHWGLPITHCFTPPYHKHYSSNIAFSSHIKSTPWEQLFQWSSKLHTSFLLNLDRLYWSMREIVSSQKLSYTQNTQENYWLEDHKKMVFAYIQYMHKIKTTKT